MNYHLANQNELTCTIIQHGNLLLITVVQIVLLYASGRIVLDIGTTHHLLPSILCHKEPKESFLAMNNIFGNNSSPNIATIPSDNIRYADSQKLDSDAYDKKISERFTASYTTNTLSANRLIQTIDKSVKILNTASRNSKHNWSMINDYSTKPKSNTSNLLQLGNILLIHVIQAVLLYVLCLGLTAGPQSRSTNAETLNNNRNEYGVLHMFYCIFIIALLSPGSIKAMGIGKNINHKYQFTCDTTNYNRMCNEKDQKPRSDSLRDNKSNYHILFSTNPNTTVVVSYENSILDALALHAALVLFHYFYTHVVPFICFDIAEVDANLMNPLYADEACKIHKNTCAMCMNDEDPSDTLPYTFYEILSSHTSGVVTNQNLVANIVFFLIGIIIVNVPEGLLVTVAVLLALMVSVRIIDCVSNAKNNAFAVWTTTATPHLINPQAVLPINNANEFKTMQFSLIATLANGTHTGAVITTGDETFMGRTAQLEEI